TPEHLLARRLDHLLEQDEVRLRGILAVRVGDAPDRLRIGGELLHQQIEVDAQGGVVELLVGGEGFARDPGARHLSALGHERVAQRDGVPGAANCRARNGSRAAPDGAEQAPQERSLGRRVHVSVTAGKACPFNVSPILARQSGSVESVLPGHETFISWRYPKPKERSASRRCSTLSRRRSRRSSSPPPTTTSPSRTRTRSPPRSPRPG